MSRSSITRKTSLLTIALGLTALGSAIVPAAAVPGIHPLTSVLPHPAAGLGSTKLGGLKQAVPVSGPTGSKVIGNINYPAKVTGQQPPAAGPTGSKVIGSITPKVTGPTTTGAGPIISKTIGDVDSPVKVIGQGPIIKPIGVMLPPGQKPNGGGVDNICPFNKFKCPPAPGGTGGGNTPAGPTTGNTTTGPMTGANPPMPGGVPMGPVGGGGHISLQLPPVAIDPPYQTQPVAVAPQPVVVQAPTNVVSTTTAAPVAEPCSCLTKQYLADGSALFRDLCTKEAAIATPAELRAQASP
jgi:hypothetical protein